MQKLKEEENSYKITEDEFAEFKKAETHEEQLKLLIMHSQKNQKRIIIRRNRKMEQKQVEQEMLELNQQFVEFLHTKGIKAKFHLVIENIKKGIKEAPERTARQIAASKPNIPHSVKPNNEEVTAEMLSNEFNEFLKQRGLDSKFKVEIVEE